MRRKGLISLLFIMPFCLLGCGKKASSEEATVYINEYKKMEYETVAVERGDITPTLTLQGSQILLREKIIIHLWMRWKWTRYM